MIIVRSGSTISRMMSKKRMKSMACQRKTIKSHEWCTIEVDFNGHFYWCECECHD